MWRKSSHMLRNSITRQQRHTRQIKKLKVRARHHRSQDTHGEQREEKEEGRGEGHALTPRRKSSNSALKRPSPNLRASCRSTNAQKLAERQTMRACEHTDTRLTRERERREKRERERQRRSRRLEPKLRKSAHSNRVGKDAHSNRANEQREERGQEKSSRTTFAAEAHS